MTTNQYPTYAELMAQAEARNAELDAHVLTSEELARIAEDDRPVALGEVEAKPRHTYCVGGYFREEDGVVRSQTRSRNVRPEDVRRKLVAYAMQESTVRAEFWIEAF